LYTINHLHTFNICITYSYLIVSTFTILHTTVTQTHGSFIESTVRPTSSQIQHLHTADSVLVRLNHSKCQYVLIYV